MKKSQAEGFADRKYSYDYNIVNIIIKLISATGNIYLRLIYCEKPAQGQKPSQRSGAAHWYYMV